MKRLGRLTWVLVGGMVASSLALSQEQQERTQDVGLSKLPGYQFMLVTRKSVQDDLKLSEDQVKKVKELKAKEGQAMRDGRDRREAFANMREQQIANEKALPNILDARQLARLNQIALQRTGAEALRHSEVAKALNLSDEQKEKIKHIHTKMREDLRGLRGEQARKRFGEIRKTADEQMMNVLTAEQKTKWKEMTGEPFKGEIK